MVDFLAAVDSDSGKKEPTPVTIVSGGLEVGGALRPELWAAPATPKDMTAYGTIIIHCEVAPTTPRTIKSGPSATTCIAKEAAVNNSGGIALSKTIGAVGEYSIDGGVFVQLGTESSDGTFWIAGR